MIIWWFFSSNTWKQFLSHRIKLVLTSSDRFFGMNSFQKWKTKFTSFLSIFIWFKLMVIDPNVTNSLNFFSKHSKYCNENRIRVFVPCQFNSSVKLLLVLPKEIPRALLNLFQWMGDFSTRYLEFTSWFFYPWHQLPVQLVINSKKGLMLFLLHFISIPYNLLLEMNFHISTYFANNFKHLRWKGFSTGVFLVFLVFHKLLLIHISYYVMLGHMNF